jgi:hypothetical protein
VIGNVTDLSRGPEEDDPDALDEGSTARDFSGALVGPVDVDRDDYLIEVG